MDNAKLALLRRRDRRIAIALYTFFLVGTLAAAIPRKQIFPFSFYPMFSSLKPLPLDRQGIFPMLKGDLWGKERELTIIGITDTGKSISLPIYSQFRPIGRDFPFWRALNDGKDAHDMAMMLKSFLDRPNLVDPQTQRPLQGLQLYDVSYSFDEQVRRLRIGDLVFPETGHRLIAEYFRPPRADAQ